MSEPVNRKKKEEEEDSESSDGESLNLGDKVDDDDDDDDDDGNDGDQLKSKTSTIKEQLQDLSDDEDDDAAPDDVSFVMSKQSALESLQRARAQIEKEKASLKEKRLKRELLYQQQKKRKLVSSADDSEEGLTKSTSKTGKINKTNKTDKTSLKNISGTDKINKLVQRSDEDDVGDDECSLNIKEASEDFIPLTQSGGMKAVYIKDVSRLVPDKQSAILFKQQQLFGSHIKRETMKERLASNEKKRARHHKATTASVH